MRPSFSRVPSFFRGFPLIRGEFRSMRLRSCLSLHCLELWSLPDPPFRSDSLIAFLPGLFSRSSLAVRCLQHRDVLPFSNGNTSLRAPSTVPPPLPPRLRHVARGCATGCTGSTARLLPSRYSLALPPPVYASSFLHPRSTSNHNIDILVVVGILGSRCYIFSPQANGLPSSRPVLLC